MLRGLTLSFAFPSGLIGIEIGRFGKAVPGLFRNRFEVGIDPLDAFAHAPRA